MSTYAVVSRQVVPVTAVGSTVVEARMRRTSKLADGAARTLIDTASKRVMLLRANILIKKDRE